VVTGCRDLEKDMDRSTTCLWTTVSLLTATTLVAGSSCIRPPPYDPAADAANQVDVADEVTLVWDGDEHGGNAKEWANCNLSGDCASTVKLVPSQGVNDSVGLEWHVEGKDWKGFGWNWYGWWPENAGTDVSEFKNLSFWIRLQVHAGDPPKLNDLKVALASSTKNPEESQQVALIDYLDDISDGQWHEVIVPLSEFAKGSAENFDFTKTWEFRLGEYSMDPRNFSIYIDNIGFDSREIISMVSLPEPRDPAPLGSKVVDLTAKVDLKAAGTPVSPYIYGVSHGDIETVNEMGVTTRRQGGNLSSVWDWKTGNTSSGHDWFFQNRKHPPEAKHPENNWWAILHRENKQHEMLTFVTMPSEWVAKDDTSVGFPKKLYPKCEKFAPDNPKACNGLLQEKDAEGKPIELRCSEKFPTQNGKHVGIDYNVELVHYSVHDSGFGRADQGGIAIYAIDNEPMLYTESHRDMWCQGFTYDQFWERTVKYAEGIKKIDPSAKVAGPALWGWTGYSIATADQEYREKHGLGWHETDKFPDYGKYGPFARDYMRRCAEYKERTGKDLIDIFVFHGYPMTPKLGWDNQKNASKPDVQEFRVRDVRKFWDETYRDPETWMGKEEWSNGNIAYFPLMKRWMKEVGWDAPIALGEYDYSGPEGGADISGAVAQAESFAAFARSEIPYAYYWADPRKHSPVYFAFKMFRNPDGKRTAVGDRFLVGEVSDYDSVSVYVFKDPRRKVASVVVLNKRVEQGANVKLDLGTPVPAQKAKRYEYSQVNEKAIGELPPLDVSGQNIAVSIAPMSILRIDVKM
jgi:hypothetical protein